MQNFFKLLPWGIALVLGATLLLTYNLLSDNNDENKSIVNHNMIVTQMETIGKLELSKFYIKDIVEHKEIKDWYLPNSKVVLIISGEVIGCIDLTKIDSSSIQIKDSLVRIKLPQPEICVFKVNHQESKVYDIKNEFTNKSGLIDKAYGIAERSLKESAERMKILEQTKKNANIILKPLLENICKRKVELYY